MFKAVQKATQENESSGSASSSGKIKEIVSVIQTNQEEMLTESRDRLERTYPGCHPVIITAFHTALNTQERLLLPANCNITDAEFVQFIIPFLQKHPSITHLKLNYNQITDSSIEILVAQLRLIDLELRLNRVSDKGAHVLSLYPSLKKLNLGNNQITDVGARHLLQSKSIVNLTVDRNNLGDTALEGFTNNTRLVDLDISYNELEDQGAEAIASNVTLRVLNISHNNLSNRGIRALGLNPFLNCLDISGHTVSDQGLEAFKFNDTLVSLEVSSSSVTESDKKTLKDIAFCRRKRHEELKDEIIGIGKSQALLYSFDLSKPVLDTVLEYANPAPLELAFNRK